MISNSNISKTEQPLVTIVALCYNQARYAVETLDSILAQTYSNIQLIIMDDASTDNSVEVINGWIGKNKVDSTFIAHKVNKGICKTLNEALELVRGEYYQVIACDDILLSHKIEKNINTFSVLSDNESLIFSQALLIDENSQTIGQQYPDTFIPPYKDKFLSKMLEGNIISAPTCLLITKNIKRLGGYNEDLLYEDYDLWIRLLKNNFSFYYDNEPLVKYRKSGTQMTHNFLVENTYLIEDYRIKMNHFKNDPRYAKAIVDMLTKTIIGLSFSNLDGSKTMLESCRKITANYQLSIMSYLFYLKAQPKYIYFIFKKFIWQTK
jgi:glycosyltransferase involved in cell wall biosynthesis